jgi:SAM-dependent methyltransferase
VDLVAKKFNFKKMMKNIIKKIVLLTSRRYFIRSRRWRFIEQFVINLALTSNQIVVDLGAGKMPYRKLFSDCQYVPLDFENRTEDQKVILTDLNNKIDMASNFADVILCTEVLEHINEANLFCREIYRLLKKNGHLILTVPFVWPLHEEPNDYCRYTKYKLHDLLDRLGFTDIRIIESNGNCSTLVQLTINQLKSRFWLPIIIVFNFFVRLVVKIETNKDLPLEYYLIAKK